MDQWGHFISVCVGGDGDEQPAIQIQLETNKNIGHKAQRNSIFGRLLSRQSMPQLPMCDSSFWVVAADQQRGSHSRAG
jgi:hypothetical protein